MKYYFDISCTFFLYLEPDKEYLLAHNTQQVSQENVNQKQVVLEVSNMQDERSAINVQENQENHELGDPDQNGKCHST